MLPRSHTLYVYTFEVCRTHISRMEPTSPDDPSSPTDLFIYDEYRRKCIAKVDRMHQATMSMPKAQLKVVCKKSMETPAQLKREFTRQLKTLRVRLKRTTNEKEGGSEFCGDIKQIQLDMQQVMDADIAGIDAARFCRYEEGKTRLNF